MIVNGFAMPHFTNFSNLFEIPSTPVLVLGFKLLIMCKTDSSVIALNTSLVFNLSHK